MYTGFDIDLAHRGSIAVGRGAISDIAADTAGGSALLVTNYSHNSVSLIDVNGAGVGWTVAVGGEPLGVAVADDRAYVATSSSGYDSVVVVDVDAGSAVAACPVEFSISGIAVSPDRKRVYVSRTGSDIADLAVIDVAAEAVSTIGLATGPGVIAETVRTGPDGKRVYAAVCDVHGDSLITVDTEAERVHATQRLGSPIRDIAVSPDGALAYVLLANPRRGGVIITVDTSSSAIAETLEIGGWPTQMSASPDGTRLYVANRDQVTVVSTMTNEIVDAIMVGAAPSAVAASPDGARLYVADYSGVVTALSVASAVRLPGVQALAMDVLAAREVRELETAS